ncbi:MAG: HIT family protein [Gammaproteobacteria bacterium]|nr:HIT family protein [Gammaproteobacteria bacterium]
MSVSCLFCEIEQDRILQEDEFCFAVRDGFPVSEGHTLIITKRHIGSFFETTEEEKLALLKALELAKTDLDREYGPSAYNIGINDGTAAGQTVPHLHLHLIPRYKGDSVDPRGGVRWVIPDKAAYWGKNG